MMQYVLREYVSLLTEERFHDVDFTVVRDHIPFMGELMFQYDMVRLLTTTWSNIYILL